MLVAGSLMRNADSDAIGGQCYTRTAASVVGLQAVMWPLRWCGQADAR
jgi:hypothetical protein